MKKEFKVTIDTEEFGRNFTDEELEEFIKERLDMFWKNVKVEYGETVFLYNGYCADCGNPHGADRCEDY